MVEGWIKETQRRQLNKKDTSKKSKKVDKKNVKGLFKETPRKQLSKKNQRATRSNSHKKADSQERTQDLPKQKEFNRQDTTVEELHSLENTSPQINELSVNIARVQDNKDTLFEVILQTLKSSTTVDDMMIKGTELASVIPHLRCNKDEDISISGSGLHIDKLGMELLPDDVKEEGYFPASVLGDGNCLPRSASVIMYGTENNHTELRVRIALELACYLPLYVDHTYLRRGEQLSDKEALVLPKSYVMYSELYTPGDIITSSLIERTLFEEIRKVCSANEFMGIWQIFALASVLGRPLQSVYPNRGNPNVRKDLNRSILPREMESNTPAYILWSSNINDEMTYAHWIPNHFCPILKMSINDDVLEYSTDTLGDIDLENISGLSEQLASWVMDLLDDSDSDVSNNQYNMDETTADQHSSLDKLTDNQSSMTVKPMDVQTFASVQPEEALMSNLQDNSEQSNNSIVVSKDETTADQHSLLDKLTDNQSSMTVKPMDVQPFASVQPEEALMSNLQDNSEQSNNSIVVSKDETTADQHSLLDKLTDNQSSMTVKPMDVQTFASVQPEEALMSNLQDNSEQSNNSIVVSKDETTTDQHSLLDKLTDNQSLMTVKPMDVQPFASVQPEEALMSNLQDNSEQSNNSIVVSKDETTTDQHSLLDKLTDNQSLMTVKPMDVQPFASVQPEEALMSNLQDNSEQRDNSIVLFQEKPLYDQLLVSEHYTKRYNEQQRLMCGPMFTSIPTRRRTCG
ncbi:uncharacterized protein LOC127701423 isoform X1 [Mytilus californianus]|uniref:uncharacterized protein LOC127701423 isoform X1 n=1 Tax=Mytilus californianus TaxID=6549 RepID=UPI0022475988|nr:uncharacterized protein LOC127701423 isoform X1 [Mytilus californianus]